MTDVRTDLNLIAAIVAARAVGDGVLTVEENEEFKDLTRSNQHSSRPVN